MPSGSALVVAWLKRTERWRMRHAATRRGTSIIAILVDFSWLCERHGVNLGTKCVLSSHCALFVCRGAETPKRTAVTMKIYKMLVHYGLMFTVPTAAALYFWKPKTDDQIREEVEARVKPDLERRRKNQAKYRELLLQRPGERSQESQNQLEEVTSFTPRK